MQKFKYFFLAFIFFSCEKGEFNPGISLNEPAFLVTNGGDNSITVIDPADFKVKGRIYLDAPQNTFLHHINLSQDHSKWYMAFPEFDFSGGHGGVHTLAVKGNILIYDRNKAQIERIIETPFANHNAFLTHDYNEIWTSLVSHDGRVMVYDANSGELLEKIQVNPDPHEILLTKDGKYALVTAEESSFLTVIDIATKKVIKDIKVDPLPTHVWHGKDANQIIVENVNMNSINFVDLKEMKVVDYIDLDFVPGMAGFSDNNELWVCAEKDNFLYTFKKNNDKWIETAKLATGKGPHYIMFREQNIFVVNQLQNTVEVFNIDTKQKISEITVGLKPNAMVYIK